MLVLVSSLVHLLAVCESPAELWTVMVLPAVERLGLGM